MIEHITALVVYLVTVSVAAERLTEILKRTLIKDTQAIPKFDGGVYQIISALFGGSVAYFSPPNLVFLAMDPYITVVITGLAVSGGSGAWNSILDFLKQTTAVKTEVTKTLS